MPLERIVPGRSPPFGVITFFSFSNGKGGPKGAFWEIPNNENGSKPTVAGKIDTAALQKLSRGAVWEKHEKSMEFRAENGEVLIVKNN